MRKFYTIKTRDRKASSHLSDTTKKVTNTMNEYQKTK